MSSLSFYKLQGSGNDFLVVDNRQETLKDLRILAQRLCRPKISVGADGLIAICGFLDNVMQAFEVVDSDAGPRTALERAGTIMPCLTGAAVFADGTIVTTAQGDDGETLQILRP